MPDLDLVARGLAKHWRVPYNLLKGGQSVQAISESLVKALAAELRESGGLLGYEDLLLASKQAQAKGSKARSLAEASRSIELAFGQHPAAKILARAAQKNLALIEAGRALPGPFSLAEEHVRTVLRHQFFSRVTPRVIGREKRFSEVSEARAFETKIWAAVEHQLRKIAQSLVSDPTASTLRAPSYPRHRLTTAELIDMPLSGGI
jgi:hypothetical protein